MSLSVHTNDAALIALQNLNNTTQQLQTAQNVISTGLAISSAKDNAAVWAIAQGQRADIGSLGAVQSSLNRATSIADVASTAGASISDLLVQMKANVTAAMDPSIDTASRTAINSAFKSELGQITQIIQNANFDGANMLDGSISQIKFIANANATGFITLSSQDLSLGGSIISVPSTASLTTVTLSTAVLAQLTSSITKTNEALGNLGSQSKAIANHNTFVQQLTDQLTNGVGNLVDADLAKESAQLQALQVQQQLGTQALSIANQAPQVILSLFK
ncbi:MAG TPA: flagellin [Phenylobacterium sp.]|jgi:flagellin|uniref:flagellin n=1 Tax=Phenylobacterium sp. TaxID=1871053 RepID=UPI002D40D5B6|nr:flagellin [Phenylobacterium sp.]HZZ66861.1 flagellin [Phenylobacterium sp.]